MTYATWLADVLRDAGLDVHTHDGWQQRGHGGFADLTHVVWHHDASPPGDSPGVCRYMIDNWDTHGAQLWVSRQGQWHIVAAGVAYHAGKVRPGKPGNRQSLGVETDHTNGEAWPAAQLASLRLGTAAILRRMGTTPDAGLEFHKTICDPPGRKSDPDGLSLSTERRHVAALMARPTPTPTPEDDDVSPQDKLDIINGVVRKLGPPRQRDASGALVDADPQVTSNADVLSAVDALRGEVAALRREVGAR